MLLLKEEGEFELSMQQSFVFDCRKIEDLDRVFSVFFVVLFSNFLLT